jgi:hypothetical protein
MAPKITLPKMPKLPTIFKTKHQLNQQVTISNPFSYPHATPPSNTTPPKKILDRENQITDLKEQISQYKIIKANLLRRLNTHPNPNTDQLITDLRAHVSRLQEIIIRNGTWNFTLVLHVNLCTCDVGRGAIIAALHADHENLAARMGQALEDEMMVAFELEQELESEMVVSQELREQLEREKMISEGLREQVLRGKEGGRRNSI